MADTPDTLPTKEELAQLPVRAIVAYAARCARRVQPIYLVRPSAGRLTNRLKAHFQAIHSAISLAENWARKDPVSIEDLRAAAIAPTRTVGPSGTRAAPAAAAFAAADAVLFAADPTFYSVNPVLEAAVAEYVAFYAAAAANAAAVFSAAAPRLLKSCRRDFDILRAYHFNIDAPVDASAEGVCRELWIDPSPNWYADGLEQLYKLKILKKSVARKPSVNASAVDLGQLERLQGQIVELQRRGDTLESNLELARAEASLNQELIDKAEAFARNQEESRLNEAESHQKTREEVQNLQRQQKNLESYLETARSEATTLKEMIEKADAHARSLEESRLKEAESHQKTRDEVQNLQNARRELQEQLNASQSRIADHELELLKVRGQLAQVQQKSEVLQVQSLWWYGEKFFCPKSMFQLMALVVLGAMVMFALFGIGEVYERQALDRWIKAQVETQRERLIDRGPVERSSPNRLDSLEAIRSQLLILSLTGASTRDETIVGVRDQLKSLQLESSGQPPVPSIAMGPSGWWPWFPYQSSDLLLSLVVLFSGTVGAVITTLRRDKPLTLRDLGHGLAAGFITFLAVRGGKSVLFMDADPLLLINPYNSAFFGLLAGMFTEMAYGLLSSLAEEMSGRLQNAFSAPKEAQERPRQRSSETLPPRDASRDTTSHSP